MLASELTIWQLADSAFPSGMYTLSHGLEAYAQEGAIEPGDVPALLCDLLRHAIGPTDGTALALAHRGATSGDWDLVRQVDERLYASKLTSEARRATLRIGRQLLPVCREVFPSSRLSHLAALVSTGRVAGTQAVVIGVVYAGAGVPCRQAVAADLFAFSTSFAGAALRLRLVDHLGAQRLVRGAAAAIESEAHRATDAGLEEVGASAPLVDVMCARHEQARAKLFAS
jgi:urease accessory protein